MLLQLHSYSDTNSIEYKYLRFKYQDENFFTLVGIEKDNLEINWIKNF